MSVVITDDWLTEAKRRWGEPRLEGVTGPDRTDGQPPKRLPGDNGSFYRTFWCWFPLIDGKPVNHGARIDTYAPNRVEVAVHAHAGHPVTHAEVWCTPEAAQTVLEALTALVWET